MTPKLKRKDHNLFFTRPLIQYDKCIMRRPIIQKKGVKFPKNANGKARVQRLIGPVI
jgi:hypothetical protein